MDVIKPEEARLLREFQEREPADDGLEQKRVFSLRRRHRAAEGDHGCPRRPASPFAC
jgi:hypothetical protein